LEYLVFFEKLGLNSKVKMYSYWAKISFGGQNVFVKSYLLLSGVVEGVI
jgi:hypothetical protein